MATDLTTKNGLTPSQLVDALDTLGVPFLRGGSGTARLIEPGALLAALAISAEALF